MSIMLDNNNPMKEEVPCNGVLRLSKIQPSILDPDDRTAVKGKRVNGSGFDPCTSSSSSSIGINSDDDDDINIDDSERNNCMNDNDNDEVESKLKISPFDSAIDALEQALPMRRGISNFYSGKSKSFASLGDAACSSIKDITKAENAYSRKRKNLLANSLFYNKGKTSLPKSPRIAGGIEKKSTTAYRSMLTLTNAIDENGSFEEMNERRNSRTPSLSPPLSPVPPPPWRSFSLADLQHCAVSASSLNS